MQQHIQPTGVARTFGVDEFIVSKTDLKGRITYANDVFAKVSGYQPQELLGQPHNIVRHPDTPAGLFKILWDHLKRGDEIFAYLNNLASNGDHYWVLAHVSPTVNSAGTITGYHSNRRLPEPGAIATITQVYSRMRAAERGMHRTTDAAQAGADVLVQELSERGQTYSEFIWDLIDPRTPALAGAR